MFWVKPFFQRTVKNFLWTLQTCARYLKGASKLVLYVSQKIVIVRHTDHITIEEKWEKLQFWKNETQNELRIPKSCRKVHRKFSEGNWRKFHPKDEHLVWVFRPHLELWFFKIRNWFEEIFSRYFMILLSSPLATSQSEPGAQSQFQSEFAGTSET